MRLKQIVWQLGIRNNPVGTVLKEVDIPFQLIPNPKGMWAADPFIIEKDDKVYIFAELFSLLEWRGKIGYCIFCNGEVTPWEIIFDEAPHYSFPYVFECNGEFYMMPETGSLKEIAIYKAIDFPSKWEKEEIVFSGDKMVDSVFLAEDKILSYKMVGNYQNQLTYLNKVDGNWKIVNSKVDSSEIKRPAGKVFRFEGMTIRPVQDGRKLYGGSLKFLSISLESGEEEIGQLNPEEIVVNDFGKKIVGTHTYNATSNYEIIDFQYYQFSLLGLWERLILKFSKFRR